MKSTGTINISSSGRSQIIDITGDVSGLIRSSGVKEGVCFVYVPHTTAGVTINENADPSVKADMIKGLDNIVRDDPGYRHAEGNSPAHIKASIMGNSVMVLVENGKPVFGTWQGIYFCEFDGPRARKVLVKVIEG
ncbi:MAG: secondary thiamine-phosphate synthase enzyme YjbQ [Candidatus Omnitrophota bacterium]